MATYFSGDHGANLLGNRQANGEIQLVYILNWVEDSR